MNILVCEDDIAMMSIIEFALKREHSTNKITLAYNGREAKNNIDKHSFDLILTDLYMPHCSGLDIVEYARKEKNLKIPIIILSVEGLEETVSQAFRIGANDYIIKPFNPLALTEQLSKYLIN